MRASLKLTWLTIVSFAFLAVLVLGKDDPIPTYECTGDEEKGSFCLIKLLELKPTQLPYGRLAALCKTQTMENYKRVTDLQMYINKNPVPVVVGPNGFYMTDHHHFVRALYDAKITKFSYTQDPLQRLVVVEVIGNKKDHSEEKFWEYMLKHKYTYTYDNHGKPLNVTRLPPTVMGLENDPFRSLSFIVRHYGGYGKVESFYFQEFIWANFFRNTGDFDKLETAGTVKEWEQEEHQLEKHFHHAMKLTSSSDAKDLPGYGVGQMDIPSCELWNHMDD